jgi:hypothetical protein
MLRLGIVSLDRKVGARGLPLTKNCWPSAKNFAPLTEIAGRARATRAKHADKATPKSDLNMLMI